MRTSMGEQWDDIKAYNLDRARAPDLRATQRGLMELFGFPAIPPADLERIAVPTALIWGRFDLATPLRVAQAASTRYGWALHVIENAADDPPIEQPDAFLTALGEALDDSASSVAASDTSGTAAAWDRIAAGYDEFVTPTHLQLAAGALRRADLRPGMRLLDVAAGSGAVSLAAARLGAKVTAVDISPVMVERLKARALAEGFDLTARVMDGTALDLEDDVFDMVASEFGVMLFPDLPRGLREMARVTRPGGRVVVVAFGSPAKVEFLDFFIRAIRVAVPGFTGLPMDPPPLPFQVADPETLRRQISNAGLTDVRVEQTSEETTYQSGKQLWDWVTNSNPIAGAILEKVNRNGKQTAVIQQALDAIVHERAAGTGTAVLTSPINIGIGTKSR
jgi:ubiquinone/menaquinone biosynthesis C-methylase UbiE